MTKCDVCNRTISNEKGTVYTPKEFQEVVVRGFEPEEHIELQLTLMGSLGVTRQQILSQWKQFVTHSATDWLLCPSCTKKATMLAPKNNKKWWQFWK